MRLSKQQCEWIEKKLLLMSLFYFMSLIISIASWLIDESHSIFLHGIP